MPLSLFKSKRQPDKDGFFPTGIEANAVAESEMVTARLGSKVAIITRAGGQLYAFSHICPHAAADLSKGRLFDGQIKCPDHGYTFDIASGRATWPEGEGCRLIRFSVRQEDGLLWVKPGR